MSSVKRNSLVSLADSDSLGNSLVSFSDSDPLGNSLVFLADSDPLGNSLVSLADSDPLGNSLTLEDEKGPEGNSTLSADRCDPLENSFPLPADESYPLGYSIMAADKSDPLGISLISEKVCDPIPKSFISAFSSDSLENSVVTADGNNPMRNSFDAQNVSAFSKHFPLSPADEPLENYVSSANVCNTLGNSFTLEDTVTFSNKSPFDFTSDSDSEAMTEKLLYQTSTPKRPARCRYMDGIETTKSLPSPIKLTNHAELGNDFQIESTDSTVSGKINLNNTEDDFFTEKACSTGNILPVTQKVCNIMLNKALTTASEVLKDAKLCSSGCLSGFGVTDVKTARIKFWSQDHRHRVEWMLDKLEESISVQGQQMFTVHKGRACCGRCLRILYKINKNFFYKCKAKIKKGETSTGERRGRGEMKLKEDAYTWLDNYAKFYGDFMPDKNETMLPYRCRKTAVYLKYTDEKTDVLQQSVSHSTFMKMWKKDFPWLKIKKTNAFSKCDKCTVLERQLNITRDPNRRREIRTLISAHNERQMAERKYYKDKRNSAKSFPDNFLSIIIDGMDQSKTDLPHFTGRKSKCLDGTYVLKTHIQGVINHGMGKFFTFLDINEYSHDANMVINTILKVLALSSSEERRVFILPNVYTVVRLPGSATIFAYIQKCST